MRTITGTLYQNTGTSTVGSSLSLAGRYITIGSLSSTIDDQLTKLKPGDVTFTVEDYDETVWTFIQGSLTIPGGLLPPFITLTVGGTSRFLGIIQPSSLTRDLEKRVVQISAQDWSVMLVNQPLDPADPNWQRPIPKSTVSAGGDFLAGFYPLVLFGVLTDSWSHTGTNTFLNVGDFVTVADLPGQKYKVVSTVDEGFWGLGLWGVVVPGLSGALKAALGGAFNPATPVTFTRVANSAGVVAFYSVTAGITADTNNPKYDLALNTVDGIVPGDTLQIINAQKSNSFYILAVDAELKTVTVRSPLPTMNVDDKLFFNEDSLATLVFEDSRKVLVNACWPYHCDTSRFSPGVLPIPVLSYLPLRPFIGDDLSPVAYVEPGLTDLRVIGQSLLTWDGTPATGWTSVTATTGPRAIWTSQQASAPASLMWDESKTIDAHARRVNRAYDTFKYRSVDNGDGGAFVPVAAAGTVIVHDYPGMRRLKIVGTAITLQAWTGSAFAGGTSATWPGGHSPQSAGIAPGVTGGIVAVVDSSATLELWEGGGTVASCALPTDAVGGVIVTTPDSAYVVSTKGYGKLTCSTGSISVSWVTLGRAVSCFFPNTLCKLNATELVMVGRLDTTDAAGKTITETWMFRLLATPVTGDASTSITWSEKIADGSPRLVGAFRDPTVTDRVIGHCGGRLFQVSKELPFTLERFKPSGMSAGELIEHICQLHNAVSVPLCTGVLQIISRAEAVSPTALTVDQVQVNQKRAWENFFTTTRVSTADDSYYHDAEGDQGGKLLEITRHPLVWTQSCAAGMAEQYGAWFGVPRHVEEQTWFHTNADTAPSWEALAAFARVTINGGATNWIVMSKNEDLIRGECKAKLVEVF